MSSTFEPTTTSRTSSTSAITATRSTHRYATLSSTHPFSTSANTCLRKCSVLLTNPACTTECTPLTAARRWVHRDLQALTGPSSSLGPFQPLCKSAQIHIVISVMILSSYTAKNILQDKSPPKSRIPLNTLTVKLIGYISFVFQHRSHHF